MFQREVKGLMREKKPNGNTGRGSGWVARVSCRREGLVQGKEKGLGLVFLGWGGG